MVLHAPQETTILRASGVNKSLTSYLLPLICNISIPHFGHLAIIQTAYQVCLNIATIIGILELNACSSEASFLATSGIKYSPPIEATDGINDTSDFSSFTR
jgi:hypothetical protein